MQNPDSKDEMKYVLDKYNLDYKISVTRKSLNRSFSEIKKIDNNLLKKTRVLTFFAHSNSNEMYIMLSRFFDKYCRKDFYQLGLNFL